MVPNVDIVMAPVASVDKNTPKDQASFVKYTGETIRKCKNSVEVYDYIYIYITKIILTISLITNFSTVTSFYFQIFSVMVQQFLQKEK